MLDAEQALAARQSLSRNLAELRTAAKLRGRDLGAAIGISQSKVSKIETGQLLPTVDDVKRWGRKCKAGRAHTDDLIARCETAHVTATVTRPLIHRGVHRRLTELILIAQRSHYTQEVAIGLVPALLRTDDYERGVLRDLREKDFEAGLANHRRHRALLDNPKKRFGFLITEHVLRSPLVSIAVMRDQIAHIASVLDRRDPNAATVELGVIPLGTPVGVPLRNGFRIHDGRRVVLDLSPGTAVLTDKSDVRGHLRNLAELHRPAVFGQPVRELLDRIRMDYQDERTP